MYNFKFAGVALSELHGVVTSRPDREVALYDGSLSDIPGRSKSEFIDNKRYKNVPFSREIGFSQRPSIQIPDLIEQLINWLGYHQNGYYEFEDSDHPGMVTYATLTNFGQIQTTLRRFHTATLKFSRDPFWYIKKSLEYTSLDLTADTVSATILNPYKIDSKPIIRFGLKNKSAGTDIIAFNIISGGVSTNYSYSLNRATYHGSYTLEIDCENETVRLISGNTVHFRDSSIPKGFDIGSTTFTLTGSTKSNLNSLSFAPRWRCL